jgi:hypothetical protein
MNAARCSSAAVAFVASRTLTPFHVRYSAYMHRVAWLDATMRTDPRPTLGAATARVCESGLGNDIRDTTTSGDKGGG